MMHWNPATRISAPACAMCDGKHRYQTAQQAWRSLMRLPRRARGLMNHYRCDVCGGFHIGGKG